jgi:hypothetical protein
MQYTTLQNVLSYAHAQNGDDGMALNNAKRIARLLANWQARVVEGEALEQRMLKAACNGGSYVAYKMAIAELDAAKAKVARYTAELQAA